MGNTKTYTYRPIGELKFAFHRGYTEIWDLTEYFEVIEDFMKKAIVLYRDRLCIL